LWKKTEVETKGCEDCREETANREVGRQLDGSGRERFSRWPTPMAGEKRFDWRQKFGREKETLSAFGTEL